MAGTLTIDTLKASTGVLATQNGMTGIAKAWVNFDGTSATIRGSFNVGSVTRNSTGYYTVNFSTAMADANYATKVSTSASFGAASAGAVQVATTNTGTEIAPTSSAISFTLINVAGSANIDAKYINVSINGN